MGGDVVHELAGRGREEEREQEGAQSGRVVAGQSVTIKFNAVEDSSLQTSFVVDDTALTAS